MRTGTPYVKNVAPQVTMAFHNKAAAQVGLTYSNDAHGGTSRKVISIETISEPYTGTGKILMDNHDAHFDGYDLRGTKVTISWGWFSGTASDDEPWWVIRQSNILQEGMILCELQIANAWEMLKLSQRANKAIDTDLTGDPQAGSTLSWDRTTTVKNILTEIFQDTNGFLGQWGYSTITTINGEPAGAFSIQTYQPRIEVRIGDDDNKLARRLLAMTQSGVTFRNSTGVTFNYIDPSIPGPYYTYENDGVDHPFFAHVRNTPLTIPNRVIVIDQETNLQKNAVTNFVGIAEDATSMAAIGELSEVIIDTSIGEIAGSTATAGEVTAGNLEGNARAAAILARHKSEADIGQIYQPMNCCVELYDEIKVIEASPGTTITGRVGRIERRFHASANSINQIQSQRELYTCTIYLGGIGGGSLRTKSFTGSNDIEASIQDMSSRGFHDPFVDSPQLNNATLSQHYAPVMHHSTLGGVNHLAGGGVSHIFDLTVPIAAVPSVLKVSWNAVVAPVIAPAVGDYVAIGIILDSTSYGTSVFYSATAGMFGSLCRTFEIPYPADGATHTLTMWAQQHSAGGTYDISAGTTPDTDLMYELVSRRNASFA